MASSDITQRVIIKKLFHKGLWHIGLYFDYDAQLIDLVKQLPDRRYSKTYSCWYIPYTAASYRYLKQSAIPYTIDVHSDTRQAVLQSDIVGIDSTSELTQHSEEEKDSGNLPADINPSVSNHSGLQNIIYNSGSFFISVSYNSDEIVFIKSLNRVYWNKTNKMWVCSGHHKNLKLIQDRYNYWTHKQYELIKDQISLAKQRKRAILRMVPEQHNYYSLKLKGELSQPQWLKDEANRKYDKQQGLWLLPNDAQAKKRVIEKLIAHEYEVLDYTTSGYDDVQYTRDWGKKKQYLLRHCPPKHINNIDDLLSLMIRERYSWNTIKQYSAVILRYLIYCHNGHINPHKQDSVINYLSNISERNVSHQEINRHQSALRLYLLRVVRATDVNFEAIPRPRRPKSLPKVMNKGDVICLLSKVTNRKHLVMLYLAYGSGLRSGEILNLKCHDLDFENKRIWVRGGKGNKDRIVPMAQSIIAILQSYIVEHTPTYWLFCGQKSGTPYSSTSLSLIFRRARKKARLPNHFTLHSLRHSFATHLMDSGTDLRLIKELLGHKDIKTTLIYTHVTDQTIRRVQSPLDILLQNNDQNERI